MRKLISILLFFLACSCSNKNQDKIVARPEEFFEINFDEVINSKKEILLSEVSSNIEYVALETNEECMILPIAKYYFVDSIIFISNRDHILKYSRTGKFLKKIGKPGRGPGEIDIIISMSILRDLKLIAVQKNFQRELLFFNFEGDLVKTVDFSAYYHQIKALDDGKFLIYEHGFIGNEKYTFLLTDNNWDTLTGVENYTKWMRNSESFIGITFDNFEPFYEWGKKYHFKGMYNDTVYSLNSSTSSIYPSYSIKMGKYTLPEDLRPERLGAENLKIFRQKADNYYYASVIGVSDIIFISASSYNTRSPVHKYVLFSQTSHKGFECVDSKNQSIGLINDLDGGVNFWPSGSINKNEVFMPINPLSLKNSQGQSESIPVKNKNLNRHFTQMVSNLDITSNPVLMIVTLKF
jgi:hypothetical protein